LWELEVGSWFWKSAVPRVWKVAEELVEESVEEQVAG
jgi:hypothetical protein